MEKKCLDLFDKTAFVTTGGIGMVMAKELAARGAHVTIFGDDDDDLLPLLEHARQEVLGACIMATQEIHTVAVDLSDPAKIDRAFRSQARSPDLVYCSLLVAVDAGDFIICEDSASVSSLIAGMRDFSPTKGMCIGDALMSVVMKWVMLPYLRWKWKSVSRSDGATRRRRVRVTWWDRMSWKLVPNF